MRHRIGGKTAVFAFVIIVICAAAGFAACDAFVFGITVDALPEHVEQLVLTSDGEAPVVWNGEKLLFDSGDVVDGELVLEAGYGLGDLEVLVNDESLTLEKKSITGNYIFSFTMSRDSQLTFKGTPVLKPRAVSITGDGADDVFLEAGENVFELSEGDVSLELETSATEPFTFYVYSTEYTKMPTTDLFDSSTLKNYSPSVEPFYSDGKGGVVCTFQPDINSLNITLELDNAKGAPKIDLAGNPDNLFYTASVDGVPLTDGKFSLSSFEDGKAQLTLTLTEGGQAAWEEMNGAALGMTVNGVSVNASVATDGDKTVFTAQIKPAYEYFSGEICDLFLFEVKTAIPEAAAAQNGLYIKSDTIPDIRWHVYFGIAYVCEEQPSLIFADDNGAYYAPTGYVYFDAWVPIGLRDTVPAYTFKVHFGGVYEDGAQEIDIYDVDEEARFEANTSFVKVLLTSEYKKSEEIGTFMMPYLYRYKVAVSLDTLTAEEELEIEFVQQTQMAAR